MDICDYDWNDETNKTNEINETDELEDLVFMMPGNWFEIRTIKQHVLQPYTVDMLQDEISQQIHSNSEKLGFINTNYGKQPSNISDIKFNISKKKFSHIRDLSSRQTRCPIVSFHGSKPNAIESIMNSGYIIPQMADPGSKVPVAHGAMYGIGVYTSPFFDKALSYTCKINNIVYMIVNLVFVDTIKMIPNISSIVDKSKPVGGTYTDGSNTHIVYGLDQIISAKTENVVPVAIITININ